MLFRSKVSPALTSDRHTDLVVEIHPGADAQLVRGRLLQLGDVLADNPDLADRHILLRSAVDIGAIAALPEVAYIFPAAPELASGMPTAPCEGPLTVFGKVAQFIATNGSGWDGAGQNATSLNYVLSQATSKLDPTQTQAEIVRAMGEWAKVVKVDWKAASDPNGARTVNIFFASGSHGDGYAFDGRGGVLAHTFYPSPPNPEPLAGEIGRAHV